MLRVPVNKERIMLRTQVMLARPTVPVTPRSSKAILPSAKLTTSGHGGYRRIDERRQALVDEGEVWAHRNVASGGLVDSFSQLLPDEKKKAKPLLGALMEDPIAQQCLSYGPELGWQELLAIDDKMANCKLSLRYRLIYARIPKQMGIDLKDATLPKVLTRDVLRNDIRFQMALDIFQRHEPWYQCVLFHRIQSHSMEEGRKQLWLRLLLLHFTVNDIGLMASSSYEEDVALIARSVGIPEGIIRKPPMDMLNLIQYVQTHKNSGDGFGVNQALKVFFDAFENGNLSEVRKQYRQLWKVNYGDAVDQLWEPDGVVSRSYSIPGFEDYLVVDSWEPSWVCQIHSDIKSCQSPDAGYLNGGLSGRWLDFNTHMLAVVNKNAPNTPLARAVIRLGDVKNGTPCVALEKAYTNGLDTDEANNMMRKAACQLAEKLRVPCYILWHDFEVGNYGSIDEVVFRSAWPQYYENWGLCDNEHIVYFDGTLIN